jgi:hypothetical protein
MRQVRGGARRFASLIALGCLLGAATVAGTVAATAARPGIASAAPAVAACGSGHANVEGNSPDNHYGNFAYIYVNTSGVLNNLNAALYRSIFIFGDVNNDVEIGWGAGPGSVTGSGSTPTVYAYWYNRGVQGKSIHVSLSDDTNRAFTVQNIGHIEIFQFVFDGESSPFAYSPTMTFNIGIPLANSERWNYCDSLYTHIYNLVYLTNSGWSTDWGNWGCWTNGSVRNPYYLHKNSDSDMNVTSSSSGSIC